MEERLSFRQWQLRHALRTDYDRYLRLLSYWGTSDLKCLIEAFRGPVEKMANVFADFANAMRPVSTAMNSLLEQMNQKNMKYEFITQSQLRDSIETQAMLRMKNAKGFR